MKRNWPPTELVERNRTLRADVRLKCPVCFRPVVELAYAAGTPGWVVVRVPRHGMPVRNDEHPNVERWPMDQDMITCPASDSESEEPVREEWWST